MATTALPGEGETGFPLLVEALNGKGSLADVPGLVWKEHGVIRRNPAAEVIADLDTLPFPDLGLLDMGQSRKIGVQGYGLPTVPIQTSRGCPFRLHVLLGDRHVWPSLPAPIDGQCDRRAFEVRLDFMHLVLLRRQFRGQPGKDPGIAPKEMIRLRLGFRWSTQVRSDIARDPEMLDLMAEAGCTSLYVGFESVDPAALREMKKNQTVEEIRHAIREIRKRRIHVHGMFVFGFDSDTPATTRATVSFALAREDRFGAVPRAHAAAGLGLLHEDARRGTPDRHRVGHL